MNNEIEKVLTSINDDIYNIYDDGEILLSLKTNGYCEILEFLGVVIWCSDNDERYFNEKINEYEDLELYIRKEMKKVIDKISIIKDLI
jgi:hypothetical protein